MTKFGTPCGRPTLPPSKDKKVQEKREKARVPEGEKKEKCGRKPLPPSDDPKVEARRQKARANAQKKREAIKQDKAGGLINENIRMKIARKRMDEAKAKAKPAPTPTNPFSGLSSFNKNRINKGKEKKKGIVLKPKVVVPAPAPPPAPPPASIKPAPAPASIKPAPSSSSKKPADSQLPFNNSVVITNFIQNKVTLDKYSLQNRIDTYGSIVSSLDQLKEDDCLEKDKSTGGYAIRDVVKLEKQIGTKSKYGAIYLTSLTNNAGVYPIASKVMDDNDENIDETNLMKEATRYVLAGQTKHLPMLYKDTRCMNKKIGKKIRLVNYNELFTGDLKTLVEDRDVVGNEELMYNLYLQTQLAIASFHILISHTHQDCHWGNFLYQTNNESGYYHYQTKNKTGNKFDFYLKSCPYNIVIYDYGLAQPTSGANIKQLKTEIYEDYERVSYSFNSKKIGWGKYKDLPTKNFDDKVNLTRNDLTTYWSQNVASLQFRQNIIGDIVNTFIKNAPPGMILTTPPNDIINKTPFILII